MSRDYRQDEMTAFGAEILGQELESVGALRSRMSLVRKAPARRIVTRAPVARLNIIRATPVVTQDTSTPGSGRKAGLQVATTRALVPGAVPAGAAAAIAPILAPTGFYAPAQAPGGGVATGPQAEGADPGTALAAPGSLVSLYASGISQAERDLLSEGENPLITAKWVEAIKALKKKRRRRLLTIPSTVGADLEAEEAVLWDESYVNQFGAKRRLDTVKIRYNLSTYMDGWVKDYRPSGPANTARSRARAAAKDTWNYIVGLLATNYEVGRTTIARIGSGMLSEFQQEASDKAAEWFSGGSYFGAGQSRRHFFNRGFFAMNRVMQARRAGHTVGHPVNPYHGGGWQEDAFDQGVRMAKRHPLAPYGKPPSGFGYDNLTQWEYDKQHGGTRWGPRSMGGGYSTFGEDDMELDVYDLPDEDFGLYPNESIWDKGFVDEFGKRKRRRGLKPPSKAPSRKKRQRLKRIAIKRYKILKAMFEKSTGLEAAKFKKGDYKAQLKWYLVFLGWAKKNSRKLKLNPRLGGPKGFKLATNVLRARVQEATARKAVLSKKGRKR